MAEEKKAASRHRVVLEQRENISITGVLDVVSFDEACIVADTEQGTIVVKGSGLHISVLNLENGRVDMDGHIDSIAYDAPGHRAKSKGSFLSQLFR